MTDLFQTMLQAGNTAANSFPVTSRYYGVQTASKILADGKPIVYLRRRFIPSTTGLSLMREHVVTGGDRLDNITASYLGDPEQFWQIADINNAFAPEELTDIAGTVLLVP